MLPEDKEFAHEYGDIKQERIWTVVSSNVPIEKLEPLVRLEQEKSMLSPAHAPITCNRFLEKFIKAGVVQRIITIIFLAS